MNRLLTHRGPDDEGQFDDESASIAMRRLSVIDLAGGKQPISNEDGRLQIVFNGEIYNYRELRDQLVRTGRHQIRTNSDTEIIVHLFEEFGEDTPRHLKGMFAFCIYDTVNRSAFLARDRFGEKPLFYSNHPQARLAFSSELVSLIECFDIQRSLDWESLYYYFYCGLVPAPRTLFRNVFQLPVGHSMVYSEQGLRIQPYVRAAFRDSPEFLDDEVAKRAVEDQLLKAVERQMVSDVPMGGFLSGGIDSSTIVAAMQRCSSTAVKTFTIRFEQADYDESAAARMVAKHLGTEHHEFTIANSGFEADDLWRTLRHIGQPFADSSVIPTHRLSRFVREHVTVCLSGDGGDETFGGYEYFRRMLEVDRLARVVPRTVSNAAIAAANWMKKLPMLRDAGKLRQLSHAAEMAALAPRERMWRLAPLFDDSELGTLLGPDFRTRFQPVGETLLTGLLGECSQFGRLRQLMLFRNRFSLSEDMLVKVDRMSMANSLEVRAPMLDADLTDLAAQLPDRQLIRNGTTKYLLREVAKQWLPAELFTLPKRGFSIPLHTYQNTEYRDVCHDLILGKTSLFRDMFEDQALERIVSRGLDRQRDGADVSVYRASHQVWMLLQLAAWLDVYGVSA